MMSNPLRTFVIICLFPLIIACTVTGDEERVSVKHSTEQAYFGNLAAEEHCAKYGKVAKLLKSSPTVANTSSFYFRTKTSDYACVDGVE